MNFITEFHRNLTANLTERSETWKISDGYKRRSASDIP